jgi:4'-phosphopantetheinyl transferase
MNTWEIQASDVHIWLAVLEQPPALRQKLAQWLSQDEHQQAQRFLVERERQRYMVARGVLRGILGAYLGQNPAKLRFVYGPHGKPALHPEENDRLLSFNVSHSYGLALYAVTQGREIGVDLEQMRPLDDLERLARHCFSAGECASLLSLPPALQHQAFYACWTRKEALIKATGEGLSRDLKQFEVSCAPGEPARILRWEGEEDLGRWTLEGVVVPSEFAGALAVEGHCGELTYRTWEPAQDMRERTEHL